MMESSSPPPVQRTGLLKAIVAGGMLAGVLDAASAVRSFGWGMPRGIASGLLGQRAFDNGGATWALGLALHFLIALAAASVYCISSRRLSFLRTHFLVGGLFYGIAVYLVMNLVVVPLSAFPFPVGPFAANDLRSGLLGHMLLVGLPISVSLRFLTTRPDPT
jgi:hypothetical protein